MQIKTAMNYEEASTLAANLICAQVLQKPDCVLGLATGATPIGTYQKLITYFKNKTVDFSQVSSINLDEYVGLSPQNTQSYRYFMNHNLFDHINIPKEQTFLPDGTISDSKKACDDYDRIIKKSGGIDLQLLGLGLNGHIGFNEPSSQFQKGTHCVTLAQSTIEANSRFFDSIYQVPTKAYTMGIRDILQAEKIVLLVTGKAKANIVKTAFTGPITPQVPASILQLHKNFILIADHDALSEL